MSKLGSRFVLVTLLLALCAAGISAQGERAVMWEPVNISSRDLYRGPGGDAMRPDLSSIKLIKEEKGGHNKKYRISDGSGKL